MYFDYAATTPPNPEVLDTFLKVNQQFWANPHALHKPGMRAEALLEQSRAQILSLLNADASYRAIFTSGATEANNMALKGIAHLYQHRGKHIITSATEHPSVLEVCKALKTEGFEITILPVNDKGVIETSLLKKALREDTMLVSLMHANNEIGSLNNLEELGTCIKENSSAVFHVDGAQSVGKLPLSLNNSTIDMLTFSAHKFFGLKGAGALIIRSRIVLPPLFHGGGQESEFRSGTADVARAAAMAKALRLALENQETIIKRVTSYKNEVAQALLAIDGIILNGTLEGSSPFVLNVSINGIRPETILQGLAEKEIYISTVSACSARKSNESSVVLALTGSHERAQSSIRLSFSARTTKTEIKTLIATLEPTIKALRFSRK